ncbi:MAG: type II toxin-antitoxin system ParD family antitoxin [Allosphingosinicella sp.]
MDDQPALDPQDEAFIEEAVESGRYASRAEVLREGLSRVREREAQWAQFEAEVQKGIDDLDAGRSLPLEEAFESVRRHIQAKRKAAGRAA